MNYFIRYLAVSIVRLLEFLFFARAIMSWFMQGSGSKIYEFLYMITEPIILPFRSLTDRIDAFRRCPIDLSFLMAFIMLELILKLLYSL